MNELSLTLTNTRVIDGLIFAANNAKMSPQDYAIWLLTKDGTRYADSNGYGVVTSSAFFARFTTTEYTNIMSAAEDTVEIPDPIGGVPTDEERQAYEDAVNTYMALENPTAEETSTYEAAVAAYQEANTIDNQAEIDEAGRRNSDAAEIKSLIDQLIAVGSVNLNDSRVTNGLSLLVERNLLESGRPAEITNYNRPTPAVNGGV